MPGIFKATAFCLTGLALATPAVATGCFGVGLPVFHCTFKGGAKVVDICLQTDLLLYHYGPAKGAPELLLGQQVAATYMRPWNGVGSSIYEEVAFANGDVDYTVHYAISRIAADAPDVAGGITVTNGDQTLADLTCDAGSITVNDFYPVFEAKTAMGQCWDTNSFNWGGC